MNKTEIPSNEELLICFINGINKSHETQKRAEFIRGIVIGSLLTLICSYIFTNLFVCVSGILILSSIWYLVYVRKYKFYITTDINKLISKIKMEK